MTCVCDVVCCESLELTVVRHTNTCRYMAYKYKHTEDVNKYFSVGLFQNYVEYWSLLYLVTFATYMFFFSLSVTAQKPQLTIFMKFSAI